MIRLNKSYLRLITYAALILLIVLLKFFSDLEDNVIISILLILVFLLIFTFIFRNNGPRPLKIFVIVFSFIFLPVFLLFYLGVFTSFKNPIIGIVLAIVFIISGVLSIYTMIRLDYVELKWE